MRFVILGSGFVQFEAIEYLFQQNIEVHILSNAKPEFNHKYYKYFENIDICNREEVLDYCKRNFIDLIYSIGSDFALVTAIYVSEKLGLFHFNSLDLVVLFQNKKLFRNFLRENNISDIKYKTAKYISEFNDWNSFPCVLKPIDSQGQRGVIIVESKAKLEEKFQSSVSFSLSGEVIVEEFIPGDEISINIFVTDGEITHFYISDRIIASGTNSGVPWRHILPSSIPQSVADEVLSKSKIIIKKAGIKNGPVYFQMKYLDSSIEIIEATPRLDGCHLWRLILKHTGKNLLKLTFNRLLGLEIETEVFSTLYNKLYIEFTLQKPGEKFMDIKESSLLRIPYYRNGETVRSTNGILEKTIMHLKIG